MSDRDTLKTIKRELRKRLLERRRNMTTEAREAASCVIVERLCNEAAWQNASTIFVFYSMPEEVQLRALYEAAEAAGKRLLFPLCFGGGRMEAYAPGDWRAMRPDRHGIPAPDPDRAVDLPLRPDELDLVIVPMLGFDRDRYRIGYGGGYYDRFLGRLNKDCRVIGVCFARQEVSSIPRDGFDVALPLILTEWERLEAPFSGNPAERTIP